MTQLNRKHIHAAIKELDPTRRRIKFVASQELEDRDGDVVIAAGIDVQAFAANPVLLCDHNREFVLGRVDVDTLTLERRADGDALVAEADVLPAGTSSRVDEAWTAIKLGARSGISIGFLPLEQPVRRDGGRGVVFPKVELLEVSSVSLPSCRTCLIESKAVHDRVVGSCVDDGVLEVDERETFDVDPRAVAMITRRVAHDAVANEIADATYDALMLARGRIPDPRPRGTTPSAASRGGPVILNAERHQVDEAIGTVIAELIATETRRALRYASGRVD